MEEPTLKRRKVVLVIILMFFVSNIGITVVHSQPITQLKIVVSISSIGTIVSEIGGMRVQVNTILPEGVEPHTFTLTPEIVNRVNDADLLVLTGHFPWEPDLLAQIEVPYITFDDYQQFGASLSYFPGSELEKGNPHGYWLLPKNAIAIANATLQALRKASPENGEYWKTNFEQFVAEVNNFVEFVNESKTLYGFNNLHAVVVFPAELYLAETFNIPVDAILQEEENVFISGARLLEIQQALANGSIKLILGSDVGELQNAGEFATQLAEDTGAILVWWKAIFTENVDYVTLLSYDLGVLVESVTSSTRQNSGETFVTALTVLTGIFAVVSLVEGIILVQRSREE